LGKGFDPIVEKGRDERDFLSVVVDDGEAGGGFEVWEEFVLPNVLTSAPLPTSSGAMGCEVENTELGVRIG